MRMLTVINIYSRILEQKYFSFSQCVENDLFVFCSAVQSPFQSFSF